MHCDAHGGIEKGADDPAMDGTDNVVVIFRGIKLDADLAWLHQHEAEADEFAYWCGRYLTAHDHAGIFESTNLARNIQRRMRVDRVKLPPSIDVHPLYLRRPSTDREVGGGMTAV